MAKAQNGWRKLSGSGQRKVERILVLGGRAVRRQIVATDRRQPQKAQVLDYIKTWPLTADRVASGAAFGRAQWKGGRNDC
jgi:hypothetical protein